ncbi:MAG: hypothetical protein ACYC1C_10895 [Chloroflexota bacterium]
MASVALDNLHDLAWLLAREWDTLRGDEPDNVVAATGMYCPSCGDVRRMNITLIYSPLEYLDPRKDIPKQLAPSLFHFQCEECYEEYICVVYEAHAGPDGVSLLIIPRQQKGIITPHTPDDVAFYLDQAQKAQVAGAGSAAIAMARAALECVLFQQGYRDGTLGQKLGRLNEEVLAGAGPRWARDLEGDVLTVIGEMGAGTSFPADGDVETRALLDGELLTLLPDIFALLLFLVYEVPYEMNTRLSALRARAHVQGRNISVIHDGVA